MSVPFATVRLRAKYSISYFIKIRFAGRLAFLLNKFIEINYTSKTGKPGLAGFIRGDPNARNRNGEGAQFCFTLDSGYLVVVNLRTACSTLGSKPTRSTLASFRRIVFHRAVLLFTAPD
jgi:hypothetical protein